MRTWKVGELAERTGLTVRTLHHYDAIGLLSPSMRTGSGHRLYDEADVRRLHRIVALRSLGLGLDEIGACLRLDRSSIRTILERQVARLDAKVDELRRLRDRIADLAGQWDQRPGLGSEELLEMIMDLAKIESYYTPEQLEQLRQRREQIGEERIQEVEQEWPRLFAEVRDLIDRGVPPDDPQARALARRWMGLVAEFTGGDPGITRSLENLYNSEPEMSQKRGIDPDMMEYIRRAQTAEHGDDASPGSPKD